MIFSIAQKGSASFIKLWHTLTVVWPTVPQSSTAENHGRALGRSRTAHWHLALALAITIG